jgi:hypothetical protein
MAVLLVPTNSDITYSSQKTRLDGRDYVLRFSFNEREERWHLSVFNDQEEPLLQGLKLLTSWPLLRNHRYDDRLPPGELMVIDLTGLDAPPGFAELGEGRRCELTYFDSEEEEP